MSSINSKAKELAQKHQVRVTILNAAKLDLVIIRLCKSHEKIYFKLVFRHRSMIVD